MKKIPFSFELVNQIIALRNIMKPIEIAELTERTESAINRLLSVEKKRRGITYPKLRHGNLKWDRAKIMEWRQQAKSMKYIEIARSYDLPPSFISKKLAQEIHGELRF